jgi:hypothetical protein
MPERAAVVIGKFDPARREAARGIPPSGRTSGLLALAFTVGVVTNRNKLDGETGTLTQQDEEL